MKIAVSGDHAGYSLKKIVVTDLKAAGHEVLDLGCNDPSVPSDYPDFAESACEAVRAGRESR